MASLDLFMAAILATLMLASLAYIFGLDRL
jgi:hypothetical protein